MADEQGQQSKQKRSLTSRVADGVTHMHEFTVSTALKLAPFLITLAIFISAVWFFSAAAPERRLDSIFQSAALQDSIRALAVQDTALLVRAQSSRVTWATFSNIHLLACLGAFVVGFWIFRQNWKHYTSSQKSRLVLFVLSTVGFSVVMFLTQKDALQVGAGLLIVTQDTTSLRIREVAELLDTVSLMTAAFLAVTSCALLMLPPKTVEPVDANKSEESEAQQKPRNGRLSGSDLAIRQFHQRLILYAGAVVLMSGILHCSSLFHLALDYIPDSFVSLRAQMHTLVSSLVNSRAIYYSLVLGGIYLPGFLFLQKELKRNPADQQTDEEKKESQPTFTDFLPRIAAILAPLLTGPALELMKAALGTG
ncbi:MAG TPA: hypothetical protein VII11_09405 [Bacteroidota bacterium]